MQMDNPFWRFSVEIYGRDGVAARLLELQDRFGLNINVALLAIWLGCERRYALTAAQLDDAIRASAAWHDEVIEAVRGQRKRLRSVENVSPEWSILRRFVAGIELDCEKVEQAILYDVVANLEIADGSAQVLVRANLELVLSRYDTSARPLAGELLDLLLGLLVMGDAQCPERFLKE